MSKRVRAHPAAIGAFVLGAIALAVAGTLIFGASGKLFGRKFPVVMFFDDTVNGLFVGAPVAYRGIRLGQVTAIHSVIGSPRIAVAATLERGPFLTRESPTGTDQMRQAMEDAIGRGLRAQLALQSLLTGHLYVSLVLRPDAPAMLAGLDKRALEIPTIRTYISQLEEGLQKVPLVNVPKYLYETLEGSARLLQSPDLGKALDAVGPLVADARALLVHLDTDARPLIASLTRASDRAGAALADAGPLIASVKDTSDTARASLADITTRLDRVAAELQADAGRLMASLTRTSDAARGTVEDVGGDLKRTLTQLTPQVSALATRLQEVSDTLRRTLDTTDATIRHVDGAVTGDSPLGAQLAQALKEVAAAAQSLRALTDYLERHPESVLRGKPGTRSDR